jgi:hypothetical protein
MVSVRLIRMRILAETLSFSIVIMIDTLAAPIIMALDTKMIIGLLGQF